MKFIQLSSVYWHFIFFCSRYLHTNCWLCRKSFEHELNGKKNQTVMHLSTILNHTSHVNKISPIFIYTSCSSFSSDIAIVLCMCSDVSQREKKVVWHVQQCRFIVHFLHIAHHIYKLCYIDMKLYWLRHTINNSLKCSLFNVQVHRLIDIFHVWCDVCEWFFFLKRIYCQKRNV